jgi:DNA modification methylase
MAGKSSLVILNEFLDKKEILINAEKFLEKNLVKSKDYTELSENIVEQIVVDAYDGHGENVKKISQKIVNDFGIYLGRIQKKQIKQYLDYQNNSDFKELVRLIGEEIGDSEIGIREICDDVIEKHQKIITDTVKDFSEKIKTAQKEKKWRRVTDYLNFIYSRLVTKNEDREITLSKLYDENIAKSSFDGNQKKKLKKYCSDKKGKREKIIQKFNTKYLNILEGGDNKSAIIYLNISQKIFDKYNDKEKFYDGIFSFVKKAYEVIENHKTLAIRVENILDGGINIKWEIYSYLTIYAEKFKKIVENGQHYFPEIFCKEYLANHNDIKITKEEQKILRKYYRKEIDFEKLQKSKKFVFKDNENIINEFRNIYSGFTFVDCIILKNEKENYPNSKEMGFLENKNELLLLFLKHEKDSRRIPCPMCGSLTISGNSFPEIGVRSWECKNIHCSERSKTNRGKRYSARVIFMQNARSDETKENIISKKMIGQWRKDIVVNQDLNSLYSMITKYFSLVGDKIIGVNIKNKKEFEKIAEKEKREIEILEFNAFVGQIESGLYKEFFEESSNFKFLDNFLFEKKLKNYSKKVKKIPIENHVLYHGDCRQVLEKLKEPIANMVTSPPYYNAREYSQWDSLYQYVQEMYEMACKSFEKLQKGGVYFFNIGDITDNEKIVVKSKMGEKRIPLGAYIILIFRKAGFELLDNIIWNKGEPQSQRHKNDGNFVPYYQRPANCYEHMFVFKKPGKLHRNSKQKKNQLTSNIEKFSPVFKIGKGGVNTLGHSAPFPEDIPRLSITCFTNPGDIVLDPYLGSGTTIITANKEGRIGFGIEKDGEFVRLFTERIKENLV